MFEDLLSIGADEYVADPTNSADRIEPATDSPDESQMWATLGPNDAPPELPPMTAANTCPSGWLALELDLETVEPAGMTDAALIDAMVGWDRIASWAVARQVRVLAEFGRRRPGDDPQARMTSQVCVGSELAPDEVGMALRISRGTAQVRLGQAAGFTEVLSDTLELLEQGRLDAPKARAICDATAFCEPEVAAAVQAQVLPKAPEQTLAQLRAALARALIAADPRGAAERHREARTQRRVRLTDQEDGMASLWALLAAPDAVASYEWLTRLARSLGKDDPRTMDARRADLLVDLLTGRLELLSDPAEVADPADEADTADPADSAGVADPVDPADPTGVADPVDPADSADLADPADPADPAEPADVAAADPANLADLADFVGPADSAEVADPAGSADVADSGGPADPINSAGVADPADSADRLDPTGPAGPADPTGPAGPAAPGAARSTGPAEPAGSIEAAAPTELMPIRYAEPVRAAGPVESAESADRARPPEPPARGVDHVGAMDAEVGDAEPGDPEVEDAGSMHAGRRHAAEADSVEDLAGAVTAEAAGRVEAADSPVTGSIAGPVSDAPDLRGRVLPEQPRRSRDCGPRPAVPGKPLVHVTMPYSTLIGADDEPCELAGYGPIPAELAREIAADSVWKRLVTDPLSGALLDHGRTVYRPPAALAEFVRARDVRCRSPICRRQAENCELDHTIAWSDGGSTAESNLWAGCVHDHHLKHRPGWSVRQWSDGRIEWITPTGHRYVSDPHDYRPTDDPDPRLVRRPSHADPVEERAESRVTDGGRKRPMPVRRLGAAAMFGSGGATCTSRSEETNDPPPF